jgi:hypothetical protein
VDRALLFDLDDTLVVEDAAAVAARAGALERGADDRLREADRNQLLGGSQVPVRGRRAGDAPAARVVAGVPPRDVAARARQPGCRRRPPGRRARRSIRRRAPFRRIARERAKPVNRAMDGESLSDLPPDGAGALTSRREGAGRFEIPLRPANRLQVLGGGPHISMASLFATHSFASGRNLCGHDVLHKGPLAINPAKWGIFAVRGRSGAKNDAKGAARGALCASASAVADGAAGLSPRWPRSLRLDLRVEAANLSGARAVLQGRSRPNSRNLR